MNALCKQFIKYPSETNGLLLLQFFIQNKLFSLATLIGKKLCKTYSHSFRLLSITGVAAFGDKQYKFSYYILSKSLKYAPNDSINDILNNRNFSIPHIINKQIDYNKEKTLKITRGKLNIITFVINLKNYEQSLNSFINCCKDIDKIDKWYFVDKNVTIDDKNIIKNKYPFFDFYSDIYSVMNSVSSEYIIYINTECQFFSPNKYIEKCLYIIKSENIQQCFINKISDDLHKSDNIIKHTQNNIMYYTNNTPNSVSITSQPKTPAIFTLAGFKKYIEPINQHNDITIESLSNEIKEANLFDNVKNTHEDLMKAHIYAYYKNKKELGIKIGNFLIENKIGDVNLIKYNQLHQLIILKNINNVRINDLTTPFIPIENPKPVYANTNYDVLNPSIYLDENGQIWANIRNASFYKSGKYYCSKCSDNIIRTKNVFAKVNKQTLTLSNEKFTIENCSSFTKKSNSVIGFEDLKLFKFNNKWCFTCTTYETSSSTDVMFGTLNTPSVNGVFNTYDAFPLTGDMTDDNKPEKNWMPILNNGNKLHMVYSTFPLHIVELNEQDKCVKTVMNKQWPKNIGDFRGSSCLIPYKKGFIYVIHEVLFKDIQRYYTHRFVWLSEELNTLKYSNQFLIENNNPIEYANGLVYDKNDQLFYISYGDNDSSAKIMTIPVKSVDEMLSHILYIENQTNYSYLVSKHC